QQKIMEAFIQEQQNEKSKLKYQHLGEVCREIIDVSIKDFQVTWKSEREFERKNPRQDAKQGYAFFLTYLSVMLKFYHHVEGKSSIEIYQQLIEKKIFHPEFGEQLLWAWREVQALRYRLQVFYQEGHHAFITSKEKEGKSEAVYVLNATESSTLSQ